MKIAINTLPLSTGHNYRGIGVYTKRLTDALKTYDHDNEYVFSDDPYNTSADVVHYPFFDLFFTTLPFKKPIKTVVTIHDVIPLVFPAHYRPGIKGTVRRYLQQLSLGNVTAIVTDSDCSTNDAVRLLRQPAAKVSTVYLAGNPELSAAGKNETDSVLEKYQLANPYFLYVGDINFNKNLPAFIRAFTTVPDRYDLVLVSRAFQNSTEESRALIQLIEELNVSNRIHILSSVPSEPVNDLRALYSGAFWYVQPSLYEGFGLPVIEAQQCGAPVISTTGGSLAEISGASVLETAPRETAIAEALSTAAAMHENERHTYIQKGFENCRRFSWEQTVSQMKRIYLSCAS